MGREEPAVSMDASGGKIIWARHSELQQANLKALPEGAELRDGERLPVVVKDMGACEIYPQSIQHNPNGRFVVVCGEGEYIIYTAMALRNKAFGSAQEFVWAQDSSEYAIRESNSTIRIFKNFKEKKNFKPDFGKLLHLLDFLLVNIHKKLLILKLMFFIRKECCRNCCDDANSCQRTGF